MNIIGTSYNEYPVITAKLNLSSIEFANIAHSAIDASSIKSGTFYKETINKSEVENMNKSSNVSKDTKNKVAFKDGKIVVEFYNDGINVNNKTILADINDVKIYPSLNDPRAVEVFFSDGTSEKAVLDSSDEFNLDSGITCCIAKKLISNTVAKLEHSTSILNKIVRHAKHVMDDNEKNHRKEIERKQFESAKRAKIIAKKKQRDEKRFQDNTEAFINMLEIAIVRAHKSMQESESETKKDI